MYRWKRKYMLYITLTKQAVTFVCSTETQPKCIMTWPSKSFAYPYRASKNLANNSGADN